MASVLFKSTTATNLLNSNENPPDYSEKPDFIRNPTTIVQSQQLLQDTGVVIIPQLYATNKFHHKRLHSIYGKILIICGIIVMIIDPLIPIITGYPFSICCAGLFMIISGICSIQAVKRNRQTLMITSMIFDILSLINVGIGLIVAIVLTISFTSPHYNCFHSEYKRYSSHIDCTLPKVGIANGFITLFLLLLLLLDSSTKCRDNCCKQKVVPPGYVTRVP